MSYPTTTHTERDDATDTQGDVQLAKRAAAGDEEALLSIMRQHNQSLYRLAVAIVSDKSEAEDVLQEAYLRAFSRMGEYSGEGRLGAWLASIVRNEAIDRVRVSKRRKGHVSLEADMRTRWREDELPLSTARADEARSNPAIVVERNDIRQLLEQEIARLPESFREVFVLREVAGLTVEETAEYLGIPAPTVKSRDFRARAMLKSLLGGHIDASAPQAFTFLNKDCASLGARVLERLHRQIRA